MDKARVVIVGGGITGLAAAHCLQNQAASRRLPVEYALLEQDERWGGKIQSEVIDHNGGDFIVEHGPDSFITQKPWAWQLALELGMEDRLQPTNDNQRRIYVLHQGRLSPLPDGMMLVVPTRLGPFASSSLISLLGKLRMGMDLFIRPRPEDGDEALADFIRRRLGSEALEKLAEPLLCGIHNAEAERQSLLATFPELRKLEAQHGSLIRGMISRSNQAKHALDGAGKLRPVSTFVSFHRGMAEMVARLRGELTGDCRAGRRVVALRRRGDGYVVCLDTGESHDADFVVLTTPAHEAARLLESLAPTAAARLKAIRYVDTGTVSLAYRRDAIRHALDGYGLVIPRSERRNINAVTWTSTKFSHRVPSGYAMLRVFFGGSRTPHMMGLPDDKLIAAVQDELDHIMGIHAAPEFYRIVRWAKASPQYDVGHLDRVEAIEGELPPRLFVTGSAYRGLGIPDCVHQAGQTAQRVLAEMQALIREPRIWAEVNEMPND